jgi:quercetin dioxygenase-like cupin family protein
MCAAARRRMMTGHRCERVRIGAAGCRASDNPYRRITLIATQSVTHIAPDEGASISMLAHSFAVKIDGEDTNGGYAVLVATIRPEDGPPGLHTHPFTESFYVLTGTFEFATRGSRGVETIRAVPGSTIHVPSGAPHTFKNVGATTGTLLVVAPPLLVGYFREIAAATTPGVPPDFAKLAPIFEKYGTVHLDSPNGR